MTRLRILQVSTADVGGGAEQVAMNLHRGFRAAGDEATLAVGVKQTSEHGTALLSNAKVRGLAGRVELLAGRCRSALPRVALAVDALALAAQPRRVVNILRGREDFEMPATRGLLGCAPNEPDVLNCHNLHGRYFDLRELVALSARIPTFLTLHDMWTFTGHCAYSLGCERWRTNCGECPNLSIYPAIRRDSTRQNVLLKRDIYARSRLRLACPSRWIAEKAAMSVLAPGVVECRVIPNGVDRETFNPQGRASSRERVGVARDALVLLYAANAGQGNPFKDYSTVSEAAQRIAASASGRQLEFIVVGSPHESRNGRTRMVPFVRDRSTLADYYRTADLFLHAAREDNFPTTVLESQACGTPVIATDVGGVSEQIEDGVTGLLVPSRGASDMAEAASALLADRSRLAAFRAEAGRRAERLYDLRTQVAAYRAWFAEVAAARLSPGRG